MASRYALRVGAKTQEIYPLLDELRSAASSAIARLNDPDRRLTFVIVGFYYDVNGAQPRAWKLTNWEHGNGAASMDDFHLVSHTLDEPNNAFVLTAGNTSALKDRDIEGVKDGLRDGVPPHGIEAKLHQVIRDASNRSQSQNLIGQQCNTCTIRRDPNQVIEATYYSANVTHTVYGVNSVVARSPEGATVISGSILSAGPGSPPAVVPKSSRNAPCACGSGEKYKRCHGRLAYPYLPMSYSEESKEPPYPLSGKWVCITGRGAAAHVGAA